MKDSKLIEALQTFSKREIRQFEKFLSSPFFMQGKDMSSGLLLKSFKWLKTFHPDFNGKRFTKENLFIHLYPAKKYKDESVRYLAATLLNAAEKFLAISEYGSDAFRYEIYLLSSLSSRKLDKMFEHHKRLAYDIIEREKKNPTYFYNKHLVTVIANNFYVYRKQLLESYDLQKEADSIFNYFIVKMLELYRNMMTNESMQNLKYDFIFFNDVMSYINEKPDVLQSNFLLAVHYYAMMVILEDKDEYFFELKKLKDKYIDKLDRFGEYNIYASLNGFCMKKINQGFLNFRSERLGLDKEILDRNMHEGSDYVPVNYFMAATRNSIELKEYEWTEKLINAYKDRLDPKHSAFLLNYIFAELEFSKGAYQSALSYLSRINIELSQQKQQMRNLLLKLYYETDAIDSALSLLDSMRHFLTKDELLTERQRKIYRRFTGFLNELIIIKCKPDKNKLSKFRERLSASPYFIHKEWLSEKAEELEG